MTKRGKGTLLYSDDGELTGYLVIGDLEFEISGRRVSKIRTNIDLRQVGSDDTPQGDLFDEQSGAAGSRKCDLV
jgi:hypothetical protein